MCSGYVADKKINRVNAKKILFVPEAGKRTTENGQKKIEVGKIFVPKKTGAKRTVVYCKKKQVVETTRDT